MIIAELKFARINIIIHSIILIENIDLMGIINGRCTKNKLFIRVIT